MGSSGLLLVGVVALWLFGAMPHWVRRSEALAAEHVANEPLAQRTVPARRRAEVDDLSDATSGGILGRPRRDDGPRRAGAVTAPPPKRVETVEAPRVEAPRVEAARAPQRVRRQRRASRPLIPLVLLVALFAVPTLLAVGGASLTAVALSTLTLVVLGVFVLRVRARRAAVRRRALARRHAARPWLVSSSGRAVQRPAARRPVADEGSSERRHAVGA